MFSYIWPILTHSRKDLVAYESILSKYIHKTYMFIFCVACFLWFLDVFTYMRYFQSLLVSVLFFCFFRTFVIRHRDWKQLGSSPMKIKESTWNLHFMNRSAGLAPKKSQKITLRIKTNACFLDDIPILQ